MSFSKIDCFSCVVIVFPYITAQLLFCTFQKKAAFFKLINNGQAWTWQPWAEPEASMAGLAWPGHGLAWEAS